MAIPNQFTVPKCCGVGGAALNHQVKKSHPPPRKLRPVQPAVAKRQIAEVFQTSDLKHARLPAPWIHPEHGVAYMGNTVVLLQEPKHHPQSATEALPICNLAWNRPGVTTHSFTHRDDKRKRSLKLLAAGVGFTFDEQRRSV